jgi:hypothetical protein
MADDDDFKTKWPERHDFYSSVGQAISLWASMETKLVYIASYLLGTSEHKAGLILYSMNFNTWLTIIDELFAIEPKYKEFKSEWVKASKHMKEWNDIRVRLAHNTVWDADDKQIALRPSSLDYRSKSRNHKPLTNTEIIDTIGKWVKADNRFGNLYLAMRRVSLGLPSKGGTSSERPAQ